MALATLLQRRLDAQDTAQLAMRARLGAHRDAVHAGQLDQPHRQFVDDAQRALHGIDRLQGMDVGKARHPRNAFVEARIVLHRARAEREQPQVDRVILPAEPRIMADRFRLGEARQADRLLARQVAQPRSRDVAVRKVDAASARDYR
ncbi:hypothetical protein WR25_26800 [Diploscapter pachys]|uniref:Uncharacterized protein n=1 Tax=Diploscapter pachys TaxID=2018661 RepID=A0A2A2M5F0_9BILA|nr:hypothetical protein WR25_26800 [Diploscapter pachys]